MTATTDYRLSLQNIVILKKRKKTEQTMNFQIPFLSKIYHAFFTFLSQGKLCLRLQYEAPPGSEPETTGGGEEGEEEEGEGDEDEDEDEEEGGGEEGAEPGKPGQPKKKRRKRCAVMFIS